MANITSLAAQSTTANAKMSLKIIYNNIDLYVNCECGGDTHHCSRYTRVTDVHFLRGSIVRTSTPPTSSVHVLRRGVMIREVQ